MALKKTMRTLHIIGSKKFGGAEKWCFALTKALLEYGTNPELVVRQESELNKNRYPSLPRWSLPLRTVWDPLSRWEVSRLIQKRKPELVQTYMGRATRLTHLRKGSSPVHVARLGGYYKLKGYEHAHAWIGNTKGICDYLIQNGFPAEKIFHVYNFIELPHLLPGERITALKQSLDMNPEDIVLITLGRLVPVKGHDYLLKAFSQLPSQVQGRHIRLLVLGDGVLKKQLYNLAIELGIQKRIIWAGWQNDPGLYYQLADMVVFPSLEQETFGNVIPEAWSYAKPVICTEFRGAMEITRHGEDVWRVPCRDTQALANGILHVLSDHRLARELSEKGLEKVKRDFSKEIIVQQHLNIYDTLLK